MKLAIGPATHLKPPEEEGPEESQGWAGRQGSRTTGCRIAEGMWRQGWARVKGLLQSPGTGLS